MNYLDQQLCERAFRMAYDKELVKRYKKAVRSKNSEEARWCMRERTRIINWPKNGEVIMLRKRR
jgi:hypothetical protein